MKGAPSWFRPRLLVPSVAAIITAGAILLVVVLSGGAAQADSQSVGPPSDYAVLGGTSTGDASALAPPSGDLVGEGNRPITDSITEVNTGNRDLTVTVADSTEGGVCVFVERQGARGGGGSCGAPSLLKTGETAEVREDDGPTVIAGIVPNGVTAVKVGFADGTSQTVNVASNVWVIENAPAAMSNTTDVTGG